MCSYYSTGKRIGCLIFNIEQMKCAAKLRGCSRSLFGLLHVQLTFNGDPNIPTGAATYVDAGILTFLVGNYAPYSYVY